MRQKVAFSALMALLFNLHFVHSFADEDWTDEQSKEVLSKTLRVHLAPDLSQLSDGERAAIEYLLEVGTIMHDLYLHSRHIDALQAREVLVGPTVDGLGKDDIRRLEELFWLSKGPIVTTMSNERIPFLPVAEETPGKNVYPWGISREEVDRFLQSHPESSSSVMHLRHVVRRTNEGNLQRDMETLALHPAIDELHPGLKDRLARLSGADAPGLYGLPYSVAYAPQLVRAHRLLHQAADAVIEEDPGFARFLRNRARDLLTDDYEAGDASWVTGVQGNLNAQIGAYETYDDALYGIKAFFSLCLFVRDNERSDQLAKALGEVQRLEDSLPYESTRKIPDRIPVGVYNVVADFGQSRGANTATILPNEGYLTSQYGRTILVRGNIISDERIFDLARNAFMAATSEIHHADLAQDGNLYRTFWHEVGHYLGPISTRDGRDISLALGRTSNALEEMKSDLISLFAVKYLRKSGFYDERQARAVYASGIRRVLAKNRPRRDQDYETMKLIQFNWFLRKGLLRFDEERKELVIDYSQYHNSIKSLLASVLELQGIGDESSAEEFIDANTHWDETLHAVIAAKLRAAENSRFIMVTYEAIAGPHS